MEKKTPAKTILKKYVSTKKNNSVTFNNIVEQCQLLHGTTKVQRLDTSKIELNGKKSECQYFIVTKDGLTTYISELYPDIILKIKN